VLFLAIRQHFCPSGKLLIVKRPLDAAGLLLFRIAPWTI